MDIVEKSTLAAKDIIAMVNDYFLVDTVNDKSRNIKLMIPRHISRWLVLEYCRKLSLTRVSEIFQVTHATIINSRDVVDGAIQVRDRSFVGDLDVLVSMVETELESIQDLVNEKDKSAYKREIFKLIDEMDITMVKDLPSIVRNYKKAYDEIYEGAERKVEELKTNAISLV